MNALVPLDTTDSGKVWTVLGVLGAELRVALRVVRRRAPPLRPGAAPLPRLCLSSCPVHSCEGQRGSTIGQIRTQKASLGHGGLPISSCLTRQPGGGPGCVSYNERALLWPAHLQGHGGQGRPGEDRCYPQLCLPPDTFVKRDSQLLPQWPVCVTLR